MSSNRHNVMPSWFQVHWWLLANGILNALLINNDYKAFYWECKRIYVYNYFVGHMH